MKPYYSDSACTIYHGDCREILTGIGAYGFDLLLTDPPYGVNLGDHHAARETRANRLVKKRGYLDTVENFDSVVVPVITACVVMHRAMVFGVPPNIWKFPAPDVIGGIYVPGAVGRNKWGWSNFIHCLMYGVAPGLEKGAKPTGIFNTDVSEDLGHPTVKPLSWMTWAAGLGSRPGERILDPFMGSGTTLRAAKDLGRKAIGIEIEERYCEIAASRLSQEVLAL